MTEIKRKGARSIKEIPSNILDQLNRGEIESANLVEFLGVDRKKLIEHILTKYNREKYLKSILTKVSNIKKVTAIKVGATIANELSRQIIENNDKEFVEILSTYPSDIIRCIATNVIGHNRELNIVEVFDNIRPFATDHHFNVRECAWSEVRWCVSNNLSDSIEIMTQWAMDENDNIRRFASEVTRPRGVWCEHITTLKQNPELGLPILEPLKSDQSKYVRDSVGNWLNDASKTQPQFVIELCNRWANESNTKETKYIIKKALRTIDKLAKQEK